MKTDIPPPATERRSFKPTSKVEIGTIARSAFVALSPADRVRCLAEGWEIIDDASRPPTTISRATYDAMPAAGRAQFTDRGGQVEGGVE